MIKRFIVASIVLMLSPLIQSTNQSLQDVFNHIYVNQVWGGGETVSGGGSWLTSTAFIRQQLPKIFDELNLKAIIDAPCGDFNWMQKVDLGHIQYIGIDIVPGLIEHNKQKYSNKNREFLCLDITTDALPYADLIMCRDCLAHLSIKNALNAVKNFKRSGAIYLLATTHIGTRVNSSNTDGSTSLYNLQKPPFNFPQPLLLLEELSAEPASRASKKSLGLWKLSAIDC